MAKPRTLANTVSAGGVLETGGTVLGVYQSTGVGLRNRIINGDMRIDQRNDGASQTHTAGANSYGVDRWFVLATGANVTGQRVAGAVANTFRYQITGAASVTGIGFVQRIEAINCADLAGKTVTISFDLANSVLTTVRCRLSYAGGNDNWSLATTDVLDTNITVTSTVTRYSVTVAVPAAATTGLQLNLSVGAQTSGTWTIGDVQLEEGAVATPFERRPLGLDLALCQRYFERLGGGNGSARSNIGIGFCQSATAFSTWTNFLVEKRVIPGVTVGAGLATQFGILIPGNRITATAISAFEESRRGTGITVTVASGLTAGQGALLQSLDSTSPALFASAEL